jgi:hypothetical protein
VQFAVHRFCEILAEAGPRKFLTDSTERQSLSANRAAEPQKIFMSQNPKSNDRATEKFDVFSGVFVSCLRSCNSWFIGFVNHETHETHEKRIHETNPKSKIQNREVMRQNHLALIFSVALYESSFRFSIVSPSSA